MKNQLDALRADLSAFMDEVNERLGQHDVKIRGLVERFNGLEVDVEARVDVLYKDLGRVEPITRGGDDEC